MEVGAFVVEEGRGEEKREALKTRAFQNAILEQELSLGQDNEIRVRERAAGE